MVYVACVCVVYVCVFGVLGAKVWIAWVLVDIPGYLFVGSAVVVVGVVGTLFG